jgi:hypothetical protein
MAQNAHAYIFIDIPYIQNLYKKHCSLEGLNQEGLAAFEFCTGSHSCFMTLPAGAAHSPKGPSKKTLQSWVILA